MKGFRAAGHGRAGVQCATRAAALAAGIGAAAIGGAWERHSVIQIQRPAPTA